MCSYSQLAKLNKDEGRWEGDLTPSLHLPPYIDLINKTSKIRPCDKSKFWGVNLKELTVFPPVANCWALKAKVSTFDVEPGDRGAAQEFRKVRVRLCINHYRKKQNKKKIVKWDLPTLALRFAVPGHLKMSSVYNNLSGRKRLSSLTLFSRRRGGAEK